MGCCDFFEQAVEAVASILVLTVATLYRILMFMVYLSASIGPSVLISRVYNYCTGLEPMPELAESAICMLFVSCWAEFSVGMEKRLFGNILEEYKTRFPTTMTFGRFTVHFLLYLLAYCQLYSQFELTHTFPLPLESHLHSGASHRFQHGAANNEASLTTRTPSPITETYLQLQPAYSERATDYHTAVFLLSLAYLVFCTCKNLHKDVLFSARGFPYPPFSVLNNCMIRIGFAVIHFAANVLYFLPVLAIAYGTRSYKYAGNLTYFQLTFAAALCGMIAAVLEMNRPWPRERGRMPFLYLENNMIGKHLLAHVLVLFILVSYYRPFTHNKVGDKLFDSSNHDLLFFCLCVAFTVLHITKYGVHAILSMASEYDVNRMQENIEMVDIAGAGGSNHGGVEPNQGGEESGGEVTVRCARCIAAAAASTEDNQNNNLPVCPRHGEAPASEPLQREAEVSHEVKMLPCTDPQLLMAAAAVETLVRQLSSVHQQPPKANFEMQTENPGCSPNDQQVYKTTTVTIEDDNNNSSEKKSSSEQLPITKANDV